MPGPDEHPPVPPTSRAAMPSFRDRLHRAAGAGAFGHLLSDGDAARYDDVRPGYPPEVVALARGRDVLDVGAGTGKLTAALAAAGHRVTAVEPGAEMLATLGRACPGVARVRGTAEATGLAGGSFDTITCAQTWHWVDVPAASAEFARLLRPGGRVVLTWNTLDVRVPWVHRLTRIMHAGDVQKPGFVPDVAPPLRITGELRLEWEQRLTPGQIVLLARTRSYWLRSKPATREKVEANLRWYLHDHLGFAPGDEVALPYRSDSFVAEPIQPNSAL